MLGKTDPQTDFFDSYVEEYCLPQEHELLRDMRKRWTSPSLKKKPMIFMLKHPEDLHGDEPQENGQTTRDKARSADASPTFRIEWVKER